MEQKEKVKKAQQRVDKLREELNISDAVASGDGPSPLMTADTLRKLEGLRIESKTEYARQVTMLDHLRTWGRNLARKASPKRSRPPSRTPCSIHCSNN